MEKLRELILLVREAISAVDPYVSTIKGDRLKCPCCGGLLRYIAFLKPRPAWGPSG